MYRAAKDTPPCLDNATFAGNVEVQASKGRGRGLFTTKDVIAGELLLCEKAFSYCSSKHSVDDDASPEVLETMEAAANIHVDDTITPDGGKLILMGQGYASASNTFEDEHSYKYSYQSSHPGYAGKPYHRCSAEDISESVTHAGIYLTVPRRLRAI